MLQLEKQKNSRIQGNIGLATAILWFEQQGYRVYLPLTDSQEDDLAVKINGEFYSVQVRTTYCQPKPDRYQLNLRVMGGNRSGEGKIKYFDPDEVDYVFAVTDDGRKYLIPSQEIKAKTRLILGGPKYAGYMVE